MSRHFGLERSHVEGLRAGYIEKACSKVVLFTRAAPRSDRVISLATTAKPS